MAAGRDRGGLGDDQARAGALGVVFGHQVRRDIGALGAATSQRLGSVSAPTWRGVKREDICFEEKED
jgi:hypothetical protein